MPTKQLTIDIPEPDKGGRCAYKCPLYVGRYDACKGDLSAAGPSNAKPGPECPQYQGDQPPCPKKT